MMRNPRRIPIRRGFLVCALLLAGTVTAAPSAIAAESPSIQQIHGTTFRSPYDGQRVVGVRGIVTSVTTKGSAQGFTFANSARAARSSSALVVFTGAQTPRVRTGDAVSVSGTVTDHFADAAPERSLDLPLTEITAATWTVTGSGPIPLPVLLDHRTVPRAFTASAGGRSIEYHRLRPDRYALDFYKAHESELVAVRDARVVGPTNSHGELWVTARERDNLTPRGGTRYGSYARPNSGRLLVSPLPGTAPLPAADTGDRLGGLTVGPLGYSQFGGYELRAARLGVLRHGGLARETTRTQRPNELAVATYNVENLSPQDDPAKFDRLAEGITGNLAGPDIVSLEEIQDDDGPADEGVTSAGVTLDKFTEAIAAAGGPHYRWRQIDPADGADGGQPGGNIRTVFLYNPARVSVVDRPGGSATEAVRVLGEPGRPELSASPGRIAPRSPAWLDSRKPLAGEFVFRGHRVFVLANHFNSKGGDQPLAGRYQPPQRSSESQRLAQAELVRGFVGELEAKDPLANIVVLGDLNDYQFSPAARTLTGGGALTDLVDTLPPAQRYSYVYQGNSQVLDHILTSPGLGRPDYDIVHLNAEFADQVSDHDPQVARLRPLR
ncbi:endonuclease/exonuclease/phosphatase family protein [Sciscionella marina]|uniref:endonuclease/exonuclease/phosphatase family protein n=1 Tax=Sciscionella marina TaxID=508770 RepID=UPI00036AA334|nr:endonuclease/exonuclease/phosphatase family protein [Sciscionella marina]